MRHEDIDLSGVQTVSLAIETREAIADLFRGQQCKKCKQPACRIRKGRFYCQECFERTAASQEFYETRVFCVLR